MMEIKKVDDRELQSAVRRLQLLTGKPLDTLVEQCARRICVNLARDTQPYGFSERARRKGQLAVIRDYGITTEVADQTFIDFILDLTGTARQVRQVLRNKDGEEYLIDWSEVSTSVNRIRKHHNSRRRASNGKVGGGGSAKGNTDRSIGRWKADNKIITTAERKTEAMQRNIKNVGLAKHGWAICARRLGGTRGISAKWVTSAKGRGKGAPGEVSKMQGGSGLVIRMTNNVSYADRMISQSGIRRAMQREQNFLRQEIDRRINKKWKR